MRFVLVAAICCHCCFWCYRLLLLLDNNLVDVSDIFYFFRSGEEKGESKAPGGGEGDFLWKIPEGGVSRVGGGGGGPRGREGVCREFGGGG